MIRILRRFITLAVLLAFAIPTPGNATDSMVIVTGVDPGFSVFYVAKLAGIFEKNGLDVDLKTGPAGGAMVPLLISGSANAALAAAFAGINNHLKDPDIVSVAQVLQYQRFYGIESRSDIKSVADLKGKKIGISFGNASESYWNDVLKHFNLNPADFKAGLVNVEPPEMVAAMERGDIDAFSAWEPWLSRTTLNVPHTKVLVDNIGKVQDVAFVYMSRKWIEANPAIANRFMKSLQEANTYILKHPKETKSMVGTFLNISPPLMNSIMTTIAFTFDLDPGSYQVTHDLVDQLIAQGKLKPGGFDYSGFFYPQLLQSISPSAVSLPSRMSFREK